MKRTVFHSVVIVYGELFLQHILRDFLGTFSSSELETVGCISHSTTKHASTQKCMPGGRHRNPELPDGNHSQGRGVQGREKHLLREKHVLDCWILTGT